MARTTLERLTILDAVASAGTIAGAILGTFFNVEIDALFVTAMLTVIGFSVHDTIVGSAGEFYDLPNGFWYEVEVGYKATAAQANYVRLSRGSYHDMREADASSVPHYDRVGGFFAIFTGSPDWKKEMLPVVDEDLLAAGGDVIVEVVRQRVRALTVGFSADDARPSTACDRCAEAVRCPPGQAWSRGPGRWRGGLPVLVRPPNSA